MLDRDLQFPPKEYLRLVRHRFYYFSSIDNIYLEPSIMREAQIIYKELLSSFDMGCNILSTPLLV
jgi:hypothetical protein